MVYGTPYIGDVLYHIDQMIHIIKCCVKIGVVFKGEIIMKQLDQKSDNEYVKRFIGCPGAGDYKGGTIGCTLITLVFIILIVLVTTII